MHQEDEIAQLRFENTQLKIEIAKLKEQLSYLNQHERLAPGIRGETLLADLIGAQLTSHKAGNDLSRSDGLLIEVKSSRLNSPTATATTKRWAWGRLFGAGEREKKIYDYVILVGETDDRYRGQYPDPNDPFVFFVIPFGEVRQFCTGAVGNSQINLTTKHKRGMNNESLYTNYMMSMSEIARKFAFK